MSRAPEAILPDSSALLFSRTFMVLCLVHFLNSFVSSPFSSLFPVYVEADLERLPWFTGYLRSLMLVLGGLFAVVGGRLCDLLGLKATLLIGMAGSLLYGLVFRTADPGMLTLLIFGIGIGTGPWSTAGQSYLITAVHPRRLGVGGALYFLSNTAGNSLGSLATGLIKERWTFPQIGAVMTAALLGVFLLAFLLLPASRRPPTPASPRPPSTFGAAYLTLLKRREVHLLISLRFMITSFWGMATLLMPLLVYRVSASQSMPAYYAAIALAVAACGQLLTGVLCDRCGHFWPLIGAAAGIALSALGLALLWNSLTALFFFGSSLTGTAWAVSTLIPKLINEVAGPAEKHHLVGLGHLVWSAAMVTGSIAGGVLVELHPAAPFFTGAVLATGGTAVAWRLCVRLDSGPKSP